MKPKTIICLVAMMACFSAMAQYSHLWCSKRPFTTRLVQVDQLDNSTVFYFEMQNDGKPFMNVFEDIVVRDTVNHVYRLLNSYNMPLSDEDHSHQLVLKPDQEHRFALEFEKVPLNQELDIVESETNPRALNFYEVEADTCEKSDPIDYDAWIKDYPVKEHGFWVEDGDVVQYIAYKGLMVTAHMQVTNEYGKYYTVDLDVQNYGTKDVLLDPARITAKSFLPKKKKTVDMKVFSAEEYLHKVETRQTWTTIFTVAAEVAVTAAVAYAESEADKSHRHDRHKEPPRHHGWHSARHSYHPYYPTDHYRSRYHSHDMGGLATAAVAVGSAAITAGMIEEQNAKREKLESSYIKPNTIRKGQEYLGYFHIKHENTDNLEVTIPMMGEDFTFRFEWQNKK